MACALPPRTLAESKIVEERRRASLQKLGGEAAVAERHTSTDAARDDDGATAGVEGKGAAAPRLADAVCTARMAFFLLEMCAIGVAFTVVEKFIFVYVLHELGGSQSLCGYSVAVTVVFEVPIFQYGTNYS